MGKGISISKETLTEKFACIADLVKEKYGVNIWFAEILGERWSYIAGQREVEISLLPSERTRLNKRFGIVSDRWEEIPANEREALLSSLKEQIKIYEQG